MGIKVIVIFKRFINFFIGFSYLMLPTLAFAQAAGDSPVGRGLGYFLSAMFGLTGVAIASAAVIIVGLLCLSNVCDWRRMFQTLAGISIVFGAGGIVAAIKMLVGI